MRAIVPLIAFAATMLTACGTTAYNPNDPYQRGSALMDSGDLKAAREALQPLSDAGDCDAQADIGILLFHGSDVPPDQTAGVALIRKAADRGQPTAQFMLGQLYHTNEILPLYEGDQAARCNGCGISPDFAEALKWFELSSKYGWIPHRTLARPKISEISARLSAEEVAGVERAVSAWRPAGPACTPRKIIENDLFGLKF